MSQDGAQEVAKLSQNGILDSEFEVWKDQGWFSGLLEAILNDAGS